MKPKASEVTGINPVEQRLIYDLRELPDVELLDDLLNIERPEVGSLARSPYDQREYAKSLVYKLTE